MKITWFGGTTFRLYIGGRVIVTDAHLAPEGVDRRELTAAADRQVNLSDQIIDLPMIDEDWRRARPMRLIDQPEEVVEELFSLSGEGLFIDEPQEGPVIVAPAAGTVWGPFVRGAVVVLTGESTDMGYGVGDMLRSGTPRLIALAVSGLDEEEFRDIAASCTDCAMQLLESGLPLEA